MGEHGRRRGPVETVERVKISGNLVAKGDGDELRKRVGDVRVLHGQ